MINEATFKLPSGFWIEGECYREADLRPLNGSDEIFILETLQGLLPAQQTTALLARCLTRLGPINSITPEMARVFTVGDREALLLHLRRLTFGDGLQCSVNCPHPECAEKMELDLKVSDMLLPLYPHVRAWYETTITGNNATYKVRFRLPTGADLEMATSLADAGDHLTGASLLLRRCVSDVVDEADKTVRDLPPVVAQQLPGIMAELDPQAELMLNLVCPVCGHAFQVFFDTTTYLLQEIADRAKNLYREVHLLAFYYHWSWAEILSITTRRRQTYVDLLEEALTEAF